MSISSYMIKIGKKAKVASHKLSNLDIERKNKVLKQYSNYLKIYSKVILKENKKDLFIARKVNNSLIERLRLNDDKINQIRNSIEKIIKFKDPLKKNLLQVLFAEKYK